MKILIIIPIINTKSCRAAVKLRSGTGTAGVAEFLEGRRHPDYAYTRLNEEKWCLPLSSLPHLASPAACTRVHAGCCLNSLSTVVCTFVGGA